MPARSAAVIDRAQAARGVIWRLRRRRAGADRGEQPIARPKHFRRAAAIRMRRFDLAAERDHDVFPSIISTNIEQRARDSVMHTILL